MLCNWLFPAKKVERLTAMFIGILIALSSSYSYAATPLELERIAAIQQSQIAIQNEKIEELTRLVTDLSAKSVTFSLENCSIDEKFDLNQSGPFGGKIVTSTARTIE